MTIRIVFMGSPEFSLPSLQGLASNYLVVGVVTQPDREAGRGRAITPPPVKILAQELSIPVIQPNRLRELDTMAQLQGWSPDLIVVAAFGQILRQPVLDLPPLGCINVHGSLLPRWRGAAPIQAAILHGDDQTGITIMKMDAGVDTGDMLSQRSTPILPDDTAGTLSARLATLGADLLMDTLPAYLAGELQPLPQQHELATFAPMLKKEDGLLDFSRPAVELARKVRAMNPWPGAYTIWQGQPLKIHKAHSIEQSSQAPGLTTIFQDNPACTTSSGLLVLDEVQPAGKKPMPGKVFLNGARGWA
jgi:methionyl-tRNA formyltransferase